MNIALKFYSCVGSNHTTLDAIRAMQARLPYIPTPLGRDDSNPLPVAQLRSKFDTCATLAIDADAAETLWERVWRLDQLNSIRPVCDGLSGKSDLSAE